MNAQEVTAPDDLEQGVVHPGFQRFSTIVLGLIGLFSSLAFAVILLRAGPTQTLASYAAWMQMASGLMTAAMGVVGAVLGLYLAARGHRRALTRLLGCAAAGLSAQMIFFAARDYFMSLPDAVALRQAESAQLAMTIVVGIAVAAFAVSLFAATRFFIYFPRPVKLMGADTAPSLRTALPPLRVAFRSFQFAALVAGVILVTLIDVSVDRLTSSLWTDISLYLVCWLPFAVVGSKLAQLGEDDRRAIRWVLLGQSVWMVVFLLAALLLLALLQALGLERWDDASALVSGFLQFFYAGFLIVLMIGLSISIFYDGTIDPDLMIRRTWVLAAVGLVTGGLLVVFERLLANVIATSLDISAVNAMTIVATVTAAVVYPVRSLIEDKVKGFIEAWQSSHSIAEGERLQAVIVFADLTGYTALTERNEREALIMAAVFHRAAQRIAKARSGYLIKTIGDAVMLRFSSADDALLAVRELKRDFDAQIRALAMSPLLIHAGLHCGEVVVVPSGDVFGSTVNLAARLLGAAGTSDIVASRAVIERSSEAGAHFIGDKTFKNVELPVGCFSVPDIAAA